MTDSTPIWILKSFAFAFVSTAPMAAVLLTVAIIDPEPLWWFIGGALALQLVDQVSDSLSGWLP